MPSIVKQTLVPQEFPWLEPRAAYIHIPFCAHRCGYCDFATVAGQDALVDRYLDALEREIGSLATPQAVETIFIGGGTPTHVNHGQLERLMGMVRKWFLPLQPPLPKGGRSEGLPKGERVEWTVEANPGTLDAAKVNILADHGVNRISLGAQSFHRPLLTVLERNHDPADVPRAVELVHRRIDNVSLDLIFGVPGQTLERWRKDLDAALALEPNHLSTYGLTYEKGTPLWKQRERGDVRPIDEEVEREMYAEAMDRLAAAGFEHYEISNFAQPRRRCRHNLVYWANHAYFGFGLGAARYVNGCREVNTRDLLGYIAKVMSGESAVQQSETLEPEERARETAVLQIRTLDGIDRSSFAEQTGFVLDDLIGEAIQTHTAGGLVEDDGVSVRLMHEGKFLADTVCADFLTIGGPSLKR